MIKKRTIITIISTLIISISIIISGALICSNKRKIAEIITATEIEAQQNKITELETEIEEWKSLYGDFIDAKERFEADIKEIADLLFLKNMPITDTYFSVSKEGEEVSKELLSKAITSFLDNQDTIDNIKNYIKAKNKFINEFPFIYPLKSGYAITVSAFGIRKDILGGTADFKKHAGIDLECEVGDELIATADSVVNYVAVDHPLYGGFIDLRNNNGVTSTYYAHLSRIFVRIGQSVKRGDVIGLVGNTGKSKGPHLHYEIRVRAEGTYGVAIDPSPFLISNY